jgi:hypothetical protein
VRAGIAIVAALLACSDHAQPPATRSPEQALTQLRRFVAARDAVDERVATEIVSPEVVSLAGDVVAGVTDYGRAALLTTWKARVGKVEDKCVLELALAGTHDAIGLAHCTSIVTAKAEPLRRTRQGFRLYELALGTDGTITRVTLWWDGLRSLRQVGVMVDADPRPDVASGRTIVALARGDRTEAANEQRARGIAAALDRRDFDALARGFADGYVHHRISEAEPRIFAAAADFAAFARDDLAACETSAHRVFTTLSAADWVALRFGHGCSKGDDHSFATHVWLLRFVDGRAVEGWDVWGRQEELRQMGRLSLAEQRKRIAAAGL